MCSKHNFLIYNAYWSKYQSNGIHFSKQWIVLTIRTPVKRDLTLKDNKMQYEREKINLLFYDTKWESFSFSNYILYSVFTHNLKNIIKLLIYIFNMKFSLSVSNFKLSNFRVWLCRTLN